MEFNLTEKPHFSLKKTWVKKNIMTLFFHPKPKSHLLLALRPANPKRACFSTRPVHMLYKIQAELTSAR